MITAPVGTDPAQLLTILPNIVNQANVEDAALYNDPRMSDARPPKAETTLGTADLNTVTTSGFYLQDQSVNATSAANYPQVAAGHLYVQAHSNTSFVMQIYVTHDNGVPNTYTRVKAGATWSPWQNRPSVSMVASTNLDTLTIEGSYRVNSFTTANTLTPALPAVAIGVLEVFAQGVNMVQRWTTSGASTNSIWQRERNGSTTWNPWRRLDTPVIYWEKDGNLANGTNLNTLTAGAWEVFGATTATSVGLPVAAAGVLEVFVIGNSGVQRFSSSGIPRQIWQRENDSGTWTAWRRLDAPPPTPTFSSSLPDYAGTRTRTWNPTLCLYNGESDRLRVLRGLVSKARHKGTGFRLVAIGDSKTVGAGVTNGHYSESDSYPGQLMDLLTTGNGIVYAGNAYGHWRSNTGWVYPDVTAYYLQATAGTPATITLDLVTPCTGVKIYAQAASTSTISVSVDGAAAVPLTIPAGASSWSSQSITGLSNAVHTLVITTTNTVRLLGVEHLYSTPTFTITNAGRSASDATHWNDLAWDKLWSTNVLVAAPDALIVNIGTNTGTSVPSDIVAVIARAAALNIPVLIAAFGGIERSTTADAKRSAMYDAADTYDLPLLDFTIVIGDLTAATASGLMTDTKHENERGYALEAAAVARTISL